jgi:hypothetical protein
MCGPSGRVAERSVERERRPRVGRVQGSFSRRCRVGCDLPSHVWCVGYDDRVDESDAHSGDPQPTLSRTTLHRPIPLPGCGREKHEGLADRALASVDVTERSLRDDRRWTDRVGTGAATSPGRGARGDLRPAPSRCFEARRLGRDRSLASPRALKTDESRPLWRRRLTGVGGRSDRRPRHSRRLASSVS